MLPALYTLADEYIGAAQHLQSLDLDEQTLSDTLEGLVGSVEEKAINVSFVIKELRYLSDNMRAAEQDIALRRKSVEKREAYLVNYLLSNLERCKINRPIESPYFKISIKQNPASVVIDNAGRIPCNLYRYPEAPPPEPDKKAIKTAIESGQDVAGAHLESTNRLEIK